jgi:predicted dehydrogenase
MSEPLKGAIIGCGRVVQEHHIPIWQKLGRGEVKLWTLADPSWESRAACQLALGVRNEMAYKDYRALLLREQPAFAVVCTPHPSHETIVLDCIRAGVPVLVEKPVAATLASVERMIAASESARVPVAVIHNYVYMEQMKLARRLVREGAAGDLFMVRSEWIGQGWTPGADERHLDWRAHLLESGGGCLLDNGYHGIYIAQQFLGPVAHVRAEVATLRHPIDVEDTALLLLKHVDGGISSVQVAWSAAGISTNVREVYGRRATLRLEQDGDVTLLSGSDSKRHEARADNGFEAVFRQFLDVVHGHGVVPTSLREAAETLRVVRAAYHSARTGQSVEVAGFTE